MSGDFMIMMMYELIQEEARGGGGGGSQDQRVPITCQATDGEPFSRIPDLLVPCVMM